MNIQDKAEYVKKQKQFRAHHCHWPGCPKQVPPAMWGCRHHWYRLPLHLRNRIWRAYRPGQERDLRPSKDYLEVAEEVQKWIKDYLGDAREVARSKVYLTERKKQRG